MEDGVKTLASSAPFSTVLLWALVTPFVLWVIRVLVRVRQHSDPSLADTAG